MRYHPFAAAALALAAAPAAAQTGFPSEMDDDIARSLPHPYDIEDAGDTLGRAVGAVLNVPIGGVVQAVDPSARVHRDETIADVAGRDDPYFRDRVADSVGGLTIGMADMMRKVAVVAPALRRSLADLERSLGGALRDLPRDRDYDRGWDD